MGKEEPCGGAGDVCLEVPGEASAAAQPGEGSLQAGFKIGIGGRARGQAENLIKQHKSQLASDRTSCRSPLANQVRLVLHTAAYG